MTRTGILCRTIYGGEKEVGIAYLLLASLPHWDGHPPPLRSCKPSPRYQELCASGPRGLAHLLPLECSVLLSGHVHTEWEDHWNKGLFWRFLDPGISTESCRVSSTNLSPTPPYYFQFYTSFVNIDQRSKVFIGASAELCMLSTCVTTCWVRNNVVVKSEQSNLSCCNLEQGWVPSIKKRKPARLEQRRLSHVPRSWHNLAHFACWMTVWKFLRKRSRLRRAKL